VTADEAYEPIMNAMKVERRSPNMLGSYRRVKQGISKSLQVHKKKYFLETILV